MISLSLIIYILAVFGLTTMMVVLSKLLNPKPSKKRSNYLPFESGIVPTGNTDIRWNVNYYLVAILFIVFDIEAIFLYVWAGVVVESGWIAFAAVTIFIIDLLIALVFAWRMGVLDWGKKQNVPQNLNPHLASNCTRES